MLQIHKYHLSRGTTFGDCYSSPGGNTIYVNIPKNASTWTNPHFRSQGWVESNFHNKDHSYSTALISLRDPVERWCSGMAEYLFLYHPTVQPEDLNTFTFDLIFDKVSFDDHTEKQVYFIDGLNLKQCVFFWVDDNYSLSLGSYLNQSLAHINKAYTSEQTPFKKIFKEIFVNALQNSKYLNQIKNYFKEDYNLINSVKFYEPR